jgi:hypothetical protein
MAGEQVHVSPPLDISRQHAASFMGAAFIEFLFVDSRDYING